MYLVWEEVQKNKGRKMNKQQKQKSEHHEVFYYVTLIPLQPSVR